MRTRPTDVIYHLLIQYAVAGIEIESEINTKAKQQSGEIFNDLAL